MAQVKIDIASEFTGAKAFKQADTATQKLTNGVKKLAGAIGIAYGTRAVVAYGKASVRAFAEDDRAARTLSKTLSNLGLAFADPEVKTFISTLEQQYGVLDDLLRPAYQKLITTTGDYRKSQALLQTALDLSAQSGYDLLTVSADIGKAFVGNTRGLVKYNLGLNKTQLAAMSFEEVLLRITKISQGQAALAADTYAGKLDKLTVAGKNAQEVLGGALLDAVIKLGGGDVDKTTKKIDTLSTALANLIRLATGTSDMNLEEVLKGVDYKYGFIPVDKKKALRSKSPAGTFMRNQAEIKAAAEAKRIAAEQLKSGKALLKAQQDAFKLSKAKSIFDLEKISIEAALKGNISDEERIRLKLMKAIADENADAIDKLLEQLKTAQTKTAEMQKLLDTIKTLEIKDPFGTWKIDPLTASINELVKSMFSVQSQIQASGKEWSSFATTVGATVIKPNLTEWNSSFGAAGSAASAAVETALKAQQDALNAQTKAAQDALTAGSKAQQDAFAGQLKAQQDALTAQSNAQLVALKTRLADEAAAYKEAADAAAALFDATGLLGTNDSATRNAGMLALQAAEQAKAAQAALAAAEQALANNAGNVTGGSKIEITVNTGIGDPNAIAEAIQQVLTDAQNRGTLELQAIA